MHLGTESMMQRTQLIMKRIIYYVVLAGMVLSGCEKDTCGCLEDQPVLFEYRYINFAWGTQDHGWLIDDKGIVRAFNLQDDFRLPDSTGFISRRDLVHNLSLTDSTMAVVEPDELNFYADLIPGAAEGEIGESQNIAADAGSAVFSCYLYDQDADAYRYVFLAQSGDWEQFNLSGEAGILVDWLLDFGVFWLSE